MRINSILLLVTLSIVVGCQPRGSGTGTQNTGHLRDGGHPEGVKTALRAQKLIDIVETNSVQFKGIDIEALKNRVSSTELFVICERPFDIDPNSGERCDRQYRIDENGGKHPVVAALFNYDGKNIDIVQFVWERLSEFDKMVTLAHEYFEMIGAENNEFKYSVKLFNIKLTAKPVDLNCNQPIGVFVQGANTFEQRAIQDAVGYAKPAFDKLGYIVSFQRFFDHFDPIYVVEEEEWINRWFKKNGQGQEKKMPMGLWILLQIDERFGEIKLSMQIRYRENRYSQSDVIFYTEKEFPMSTSIEESWREYVDSRDFPTCSKLIETFQ